MLPYGIHSHELWPVFVYERTQCEPISPSVREVQDFDGVTVGLELTLEPLQEIVTVTDVIWKADTKQNG